MRMKIILKPIQFTFLRKFVQLLHVYVYGNLFKKITLLRERKTMICTLDNAHCNFESTNQTKNCRFNYLGTFHQISLQLSHIQNFFNFA